MEKNRGAHLGGSIDSVSGRVDDRQSGAQPPRKLGNRPTIQLPGQADIREQYIDRAVVGQQARGCFAIR
jgi:hypothetical protein